MQMAPFKRFVGTDCTSIWAAATSGPSSLGIHLLACMLARAWDAPEATSIWVELVGERQQEIEKAIIENQIISTTTLIAARQDITRSEIGMWDASARSWLRRADQAKLTDHCQFLLIVKNVNLEFGATKSTYHKVINAWTVAMTCLEKLLNGLPQQISDRAVLLALSAWHLFPDLVVFSGDAIPVKFKDPLVPNQAIMTLGLESFRNSSTSAVESPRWSLSLSHLRYYGDPVRVESNDDMSRVNFLQLHIAALGGMFSNWGISRPDMFHAINWMACFWGYLNHGSLESTTYTITEELSWVRGLAEAATYVRGTRSKELSLCMNLLDFGRRRARSFLENSAQSAECMRPYFGLCNPAVMGALSESIDVEAGIRYLREIAQTSSLRGCKGLICFIQEVNGLVYYEYATATPHVRKTDKRLHNGTFKTELVHGRWIGALAVRQGDRKLQPIATKVSISGCSCRGSCTPSSEISCTCHANGMLCGTACHHEDAGGGVACTNAFQRTIDLDSRYDSIVAKGEVCTLFGDQQYRDPGGATNETLYWHDPPLLFEHDQCRTSRTTLDQPTSCRCFELRSKWPAHVSLGYYSEAKLELCARSRTDGGLLDGFSLYVAARPELGFTKWDYERAAADGSKTCVKPETGVEWLKNGAAYKTRVWDFLSALRKKRVGSVLNFENFVTLTSLNWKHSQRHTLSMLIGDHKPSENWFRSLEALSAASHIYKDFSGASVSLKVLSRPLHEARWIPMPSKRDYPVAAHNLYANSWVDRSSSSILTSMQREDTFACIAMFETGELNIWPTELNSVLALCSENSIFVAGVLLGDPFTRTHGTDVRHIVGNIGHAGMTMMISPDKPKIRPCKEGYNIVQHAEYDFKREDSFKGTSLHLSFTEWKQALSTGTMGVIDHEVHFLESVVSLWDHGEWVADLDILGLECHKFSVIKGACSCGAPMRRPEGQELISLDSWEELLDPPGIPGIFRAYGNWAARLAAVSLLIQKGQSRNLGIIGGEVPCWKCLEQKGDLSEFIID